MVSIKARYNPTVTTPQAKVNIIGTGSEPKKYFIILQEKDIYIPTRNTALKTLCLRGTLYFFFNHKILQQLRVTTIINLKIYVMGRQL